MQQAAPNAPATITPEDVQALLERNDEVGQLARLVRHLSVRQASSGAAE